MNNMELAGHYRELFIKHGDSPQAVQWSDQATQEKRFEILTSLADLNGRTLLDFGCGTGHLATYIKKKNLAITHYSGVDIVNEMLLCAVEKHPEYSFYHLEEEWRHVYDYVFICGVFNNVMADNRRFYRDTIKELFQLCRHGMAFNMMSSYVDYYAEDLFYEKPEEVFSFIKKEISPYVVLRNDYLVKENSIPFEFTMYVYKNSL